MEMDLSYAIQLKRGADEEKRVFLLAKLPICMCTVYGDVLQRIRLYLCSMAYDFYNHMVPHIRRMD